MDKFSLILFTVKILCYMVFKTDHYLMLEGNVYTHKSEVDYGTDQVRLLFKVPCTFTKYIRYRIAGFMCEVQNL